MFLVYYGAVGGDGRRDRAGRGPRLPQRQLHRHRPRAAPARRWRKRANGSRRRRRARSSSSSTACSTASPTPSSRFSSGSTNGWNGSTSEIFDRPEPGQLEEITALRRELVELRRVVTPQRDLLARGVDDILEIPGLEADSRNYFRDVYDHAIRISDQIDSYRDLLAGTRDAYLSVVSNRLNQITKQLTVVATIFLPLSFIVGFFGQNFKWLVDQHRLRAATSSCSGSAAWCSR